MEALRAAEKIHRAAHIERDDRWQPQPVLEGSRTYEIAGRKKTETRSEYTVHGSEREKRRREGILSYSEGTTGGGKKIFWAVRRYLVWVGNVSFRIQQIRLDYPAGKLITKRSDNIRPASDIVLLSQPVSVSNPMYLLG